MVGGGKYLEIQPKEKILKEPVIEFTGLLKSLTGHRIYSTDWLDSSSEAICRLVIVFIPFVIF